MTAQTFTQEQVNAIVAEAMTQARQEAEKFFREQLGGRDQYPCGFAWTNIYGVKGNTRLGKMLKAAGVNQNDYTKKFELWNPAKIAVQNVDTLDAGARAAAKVFRRYGFDAYADSRLD